MLQLFRSTHLAAPVSTMDGRAILGNGHRVLCGDGCYGPYYSPYTRSVSFDVTRKLDRSSYPQESSARPGMGRGMPGMGRGHRLQ